MRNETKEKTWRPTDNDLPHTDFHYRDPQPMQVPPKEPTMRCVGGVQPLIMTGAQWDALLERLRRALRPAVLAEACDDEKRGKERQ